MAFSEYLFEQCVRLTFGPRARLRQYTECIDSYGLAKFNLEIVMPGNADWEPNRLKIIEAPWD